MVWMDTVKLAGMSDAPRGDESTVPDRPAHGTEVPLSQCLQRPAGLDHART